MRIQGLPHLGRAAETAPCLRRLAYPPIS